jgi:hypothetical protein
MKARQEVGQAYLDSGIIGDVPGEPRAISEGRPVDPDLTALRDDLARRLRLVRSIWHELKPSLPPGAGRRYFAVTAMAFTGVLLAGGFWRMVRRQTGVRRAEGGAETRTG